jgi:ubiquinone/menaquinone biosynthesis C-methylase UbiE
VAFADDLEQLPVDRAVLDVVVRRFTGDGPVLDVGCGPAQVATNLAGRGVSVVGVDLAPGMLAAARRRSAGLRLLCADMRSLPVRSRSCSGAVTFYSLQHVPRAAIGAVFRELGRVLVRDGILVVATHLGEGEVYLSEFLGHHLDPVGGTYHAQDELERALVSEAFVIEDVRHRDPLAHEHQSRRIYLIARLTET